MRFFEDYGQVTAIIMGSLTVMTAIISYVVLLVETHG